ncbi:MAG: hypothetical protein E6G55_01310 [Actinobacteria bacterium]|nr:MAG: hypothetical protein E6G55_01310 [Actinomycetota bacterium]
MNLGTVLNEGLKFTVTVQRYGGMNAGESVHEVVPHCIREDGLLQLTIEGEEVTSDTANATRRDTIRAAWKASL